MILRLLVALALIIFGVQTLFGEPPFSPKGYAQFISLFMGFTATILLYIARTNIRIRRQFAKRPEVNREFVWTISDQGINTCTAVSKSEFQWSLYQKIISIPAGFVFMLSEQHYNFLPTRAFSSPADIENLKTLARQHATDFKEVK